MAPSPRFLFKQAATLSKVRWGVLAITLGLALLARGLGVSTRLFEAYLIIIGIAALFNTISYYAYQHYQIHPDNYSPRQVLLLEAWTAAQISADLVLLIAGIHYTGGLDSPGIYLLMIYITGIAMTYGSPRPVITFTFISIVLFTGLALAYENRLLNAPPVFRFQYTVPSPSLIVTIASIDSLLVLMGAISLSQSHRLRAYWEQAEKERAFFAALHDLSQDGMQYHDLQQTVQVIAQKMQSLLTADQAYVVIWKKEKGELLPLVTYGIHGKIQGRVLTPEERQKFREMCHTILQRLQLLHPFWINTKEGDALPSVMRARMQEYSSLLLLPLYAPGENNLFGSLTLAFRKVPNDTETKLRHAKRALEIVAPLFAHALNLHQTAERLQLVQQLARDVTGFTQNLNPRFLANDITENAAKLFDADAALLLPFPSSPISQTVLEKWHAIGIANHLAQKCYEQSHIYQALLQNENITQLIFPTDLPLLPDTLQEICTAHKFHLLALSIVPSPRTPIGLLVLMWHQPRQFLTPHEIAVSQLFTARAGAALYNAHLYTILRREARTDALTGLPNRRALNKALEKEQKRSQRYHHPFSVAMLDINGFKAINDTFGHQAGDLALQHVATLLKSNLRETDFAGRFGGDEFVIIFPETDMQGAQHAMKLVSQAIANHRFDFLSEDYRMEIAYGIAAYPEDGQDVTTLLEIADRRLYLHKPTK